jgi:hypothetical protein
MWANAANGGNAANGANGVFRQVAVPPWRDAAVVLWPGLFAMNSVALKASGKRGLSSNGKARKRFPDN